MTRFTTLDLVPPAAITFFTPSRPTTTPTNANISGSIVSALIYSAFEGARKELVRYERYGPGWDGYQARPFESDVLATAERILDLSETVFIGASVPPALVTTGPASDGSVDVELEVGDRRVLITLYPNEDTFRFAAFDPDGPHEDTAPMRNTTLERWLGWLHGSQPLPSHVDQDPQHP